MTFLKVYYLAESQLLFKLSVEQEFLNQHPESIISKHRIERYEKEIEEVHALILKEESLLSKANQ